MSSSSPAVEQSRFREHDGTRTYRSYPSTSMDSGLEILHQAWRSDWRFDAAANDDGVERAALE
jgi:hypothetical protein